MVRGVRGLWFAGLIGLALLLSELLGVRAMQHAPLPVAVTPAQAKTVAAAWLGDGEMSVLQEENRSVSRHLHERGMTDDFRKEADDANKPLVMWKVTSDGKEVWVNRQNGRVEGVRGVTLALLEGTEEERAARVRQALHERFGVEGLSVSTIKKESAGRVLIGFVTGYQYEGLREVIEAEVVGDRWVSFSHRLEVIASDGAWDLDEPENSTAAKTVGSLANLLLMLVGIAVVIAGFAAFWKRELAGRRLYGEALVSVSMLAVYWVRDPSWPGLMIGLASAVILFCALISTAKGSAPLGSSRLREQVLAGYGVFGVLAGVSTLLLWAANLSGAWVSDLQQQAALALSPWPLLLVGMAAGGAAVYEELIFRRMGDRFLSRWVRSAAAVGLITSLLWSLGHLSYAVSPWYYRLLELGLVIGPLLFWMYRRYGLGAVITGHFLYNAFLSGVALVGAFGSYWGFGWLVVPLVLFLLMGRKKGLRV